MTARTVSDWLERPEERTKREGREVAGARRLGVLHCHSVITETVLGLSRVICETQLQSYRMKPWWCCVLIHIPSQLYHHPVLITLTLYVTFVQVQRSTSSL